MYVAKSGLQLDTLDEDRLKKIKQLEAYERPLAQEAELELQKPVFLTPLNRLFLISIFLHNILYILFYNIY